MLKKVASTLLAQFLVIAALAQADPQVQLEKITPVSPTAASISKYGNIPVSYFTGTPNISIPMFQVGSGELSIPISLNYQFNGLKVEEIAPWVGLGWSLQAGGCISRTVRGIADEGANGYKTIANSGQMTVKFMIDSQASVTYGDAIREYWKLAARGQYDLEPDMYFFNFPGGSGKFYYDQEDKKYHLLPAQNIKIEDESTVGGFILTAGNGTRYYFTKEEYTTAQLPTCAGVPAQAGSSRNVTSWYLSKIVNKNQTDSITLDYTDTYYEFDNISGTSKYHLLVSTGDAVEQTPELDTYSCNQHSIMEGKRISTITFRNGSVKFTPFSFYRCDLYGDAALSKVELFDIHGKMLRRFNFSYGYFGTSTNPTNCSTSNVAWRLKLQKVWEEGLDSSAMPPYVFSYQEDYGFPSRLSYAQDHWGYYNGASSNSSLIPETFWQSLDGRLHDDPGADRLPNFIYAQQGAIKNIKYPTGGSTEFEFENNEVKDTTLQPSYTWHSEHIEGDHNGGVQTLYTDTFYINEAPGYYNFNHAGAFIDLSFESIGCDLSGGASNCAVLTVEPLSAGATGFGPLTSSQYGVYFPNGKYVLKASFNQSPAGYEDFYFSANWRQPVSTNSNLIAGIRIKKITDYDGIISTKINVRTFDYRSDEDSLSSGKVCVNPNYYTSNFHHDFWSFTMGAIGCEGHLLSRDFLKVSSISNYPLVSVGGGYVGYKQVTVYYGEDTKNGKTIYRYDFAPDDVSAFPATQTSKEWMRGILLSQEDNKQDPSAYSKLKKDSTEYTPLVTIDSSMLKITYGLKTYFTQAVDVQSNCPDPDVTATQAKEEAAIPAVQEYYTVSGNSMPGKKSSYLYDGATPIVTTQDFSYNGKNYLPKESRTVDSKGDTIIMRYKYPVDYTLTDNSPSWLYQLLQHGMTAVPIEKLITRKKSGGNEYVIGGIISEYRDDQPLIAKIYSLDIAVPVELSGVTQSNIDGTGTFIKDARYQERIDFDAYDITNNMLQQHKTDDFANSYIWDYRNAFLVAEVKNAASTDIAYTSFEADGTGSWALGSSARDTADAITGGQSYNANSDISKSSLTSSMTYIVSYWTRRNSPFTIAGTISGYPLKGKTINGWSLYVHKVTGQTTISVSGSGLIDELRLYPAKAQMTSYTYQPLVGTTSSCDAGNRITYYEYDGLQRLKRIRDQDHNIIKSIDYQYQGSTGCGANCYILTMQTLAGTNTLGYPVGVFDVHGKLLGNAAGASQYVSLWNNDTADSRVGTLAMGADSLHFNMTLNSGQSLPSSVTGCRYYQVDLAWSNFDGLRNRNAAYVDFGDGTGIRLPASPTEIAATLPDRTTVSVIFSGEEWANVPYYIHTYPDTTLKTLTFYHNDDTLNDHLDNINGPATSLTRLTHFRGNLPQNLTIFGGSCYQQASMNTVDSIYNWSSIHNITYINFNKGDGINSNTNMAYPQDFMQYNKGLEKIFTTRGYYFNGIQDTTFKLSRLKSDWNTYFTKLQTLYINDDHWNREDLSALHQLSSFWLVAASQNHTDNANSPLAPIPSSVLDSVLNQFARGAGQTVSNGIISLSAGGSLRTSASDAAVQLLLSKGWTIYINGVALTNP